MSAILFDLDGTLVDSLPDIAASTHHVQARFGLPPSSLAAVREMIGSGLPHLLRLALAPRSEEPGWLDAALPVYREHHRRQCTAHVVPFPGVVEALRAWHREGRPMGVVTNKPVEFARRILSHLELSQFLPVVVGGDSLPQRKPDPAPVLAALAELAVRGPGGDHQPQETGLMVGDSVHDVVAGRAAGLRTAVVAFGYRPLVELLRAEPDEVWHRFGGRGSPIEAS